MTALSSVQSLSRVRLFATPWMAARQASLSITNCRSLPKHTSMELVMRSSHLILCHPLLLLPSIFPSIKVFSNESALHIRWPKYYSFSFNISPSNEHPGLISFRMDLLDLLQSKGLKSLLQHHSSKASILQCSAFFIFQLSHQHVTTGKTTALTRWTFVDKVMFLLFNMLSRLVITFLPSLCIYNCAYTQIWREELLTPVFLPRESHGQRSLAGYSPWGHKMSDTTEWLTLSHTQIYFCYVTDMTHKCVYVCTWHLPLGNSIFKSFLPSIISCWNL